MRDRRRDAWRSVRGIARGRWEHSNYITSALGGLWVVGRAMRRRGAAGSEDRKGTLTPPPRRHFEPEVFDRARQAFLEPNRSSVTKLPLRGLNIGVRVHDVTSPAREKLGVGGRSQDTPQPIQQLEQGALHPAGDVER